MKLATAFISAAVLMLSGCATTMTPEQHNMFAQDYTLLHICSEQGMMDQNLAAHGLSLYRNRLNNHKADTNLIDSQVKQYYQQKDSVNSNLCNQYSVKLRSELIQRQEAAESAAAFNNALADFNDSIRKSNEGWQRIIESNNSRIRNQSCYSTGFGGVNCYTY